MKKIEFIHITKHDLKDVKATDNKYMILSFFIGNYRFDWDIDRVIVRLEQIRSGEKRFDEIQDPDIYWSFGASSGYFECDQETAYLEPLDNPSMQPLELPLQEVIDLFKEWKNFLGDKG